MMRAAIVLTAWACALAMALDRSRGSARSQDLPKPVVDPEAYAVYASLLPADGGRAPQARRLVIQQETGANPQCMPSGPPMETTWRAVVENYRTENAAVRTIRPRLPLASPYVVVPSAEIDALFLVVPGNPELGWSGFYKRYPDSDGFFVLSAVGFDRPKTRAMVYLAHACGALCGGGTHHLLEKRDGRWREADVPGLTTCSWVS
jgi:hypothetical protein